MDYKKLIANIQTFSLDKVPLGGQGYERVLLVLFGYTGHGLSSFVNSCMYALHEGEFTEHAEVADTHGGVTMNRNSFQLRNNIFIVDNRGFPTMDEFYQAEVYAQLGNFLPIERKVNWKDNFRAMIEELELEPNYTDFIVPILVFSCKCPIPTEEKDEMRKFMENCTYMTGIFPIVVLTHASNGNYLQTESKFRLFGAETVIPIENYTQESHIKTLDRTTKILMVIDSALRNVRYRLGQPRNPMRDEIDRKKFLLDFIHKSDKVKNERRRKRSEEEK